MATRVRLDENFPVLKRRGLVRHRLAENFQFALNGRAYQWPTSKALTLFPAQLMTFFANDKRFQQMLLPLPAAAQGQPYWKQIANKVGGGDQFDFFYQFQVPKDKAPPPGFNILSGINDINASLAAINSQTGDTSKVINALLADSPDPVNQGYCLRFTIDSYDPSVEGVLFNFFFGQYALQVLSTGDARLYWQKDLALPFVGNPVHEFRWYSDGDRLDAGTVQSIIIYPHQRNLIEFVCGSVTRHRQFVATPGVHGTGGFGLIQREFSTSSAYQTHEKTKNADGTYTITKSAKWGLVVSTLYRPRVQPTYLVFRNDVRANPLDSSTGSPIYNFVWDSWFQMEESAQMPAAWALDSDCPKTCQLSSALYDNEGLGVNDPPFNGGHGHSRPQMGVSMRGDGHYGTDPTWIYSSASPEVYGYAIKIPPIVEIDDRTTLDFGVREFECNIHGDPEAVSATILLDNSRLQVEDFKERGYIPLRVYDDETLEVYFEGVAIEVDSSEAPAQGPNSLKLTCRGMADSLIRHRCLNLDFTLKTEGGAYSWVEAVLECFNHGGFDETSVVIEDRDKYDFPLWQEAGQNNEKQGLAPSAADRWRVMPNQPLYHFMQALIVETIGWHWDWINSTASRTSQFDPTIIFTLGYWNLWKRPRPSPDNVNPGEIDNLPVVAAYFKDRASLDAYRAINPGVPCYLHVGKRRKTSSPECTSILGVTLAHGVLPTDGQVQASGEGTASTQAELAKFGYVKNLWRNPNGADYTRSDQVAHKADRTSPDYMGREITWIASLLNAGSMEAYTWMGRRIYEDKTFAKGPFLFFEADYGDDMFGTPAPSLRRWAKVVIDDEEGLLMTCEPHWGAGMDTLIVKGAMGNAGVVQFKMHVMHRVRYQFWKVRKTSGDLPVSTVPPPR